jgi:hypothetical protein
VYLEMLTKIQKPLIYMLIWEGMVCHCAHDIQETYSSFKGFNTSPCQWAQGLVIKLLKMTHGQCLYRCVQIHDKVAGTCIIARKEETQCKIERQLELGMEDHLDVDQYLAEINTNDLESGSGEHSEFWLLVICAARRLAYSGGNNN